MMQKNLSRTSLILHLLQYSAALIPFLLTLRTVMEKKQDHAFLQYEKVGAELLSQTFLFEHEPGSTLKDWQSLQTHFLQSFKAKMHRDIPKDRLPTTSELTLFKKLIGRESKLLLDEDVRRYFLISSLIDIQSKLRIEILRHDTLHVETLVQELQFSLETSEALFLMEPIRKALKENAPEAKVLDAIETTESKTLAFLIEKLDANIQSIAVEIFFLIFFGSILAPLILISMFTRFIKPLTQEFILLRKRLNILFKGAKNGIFEWDIQKNALFFDISLFQSLQLDASKYKIQSMEDWIQCIDERDVQGFRALVQERKNPFSYNYRIKSPSGIQWIETSGFFSFDPKGQAEALIGLHKNVTEEYQTREALAEATAAREAQAKLATLGEISSGMAHEINNPLTVLISRLSRLRKKIQSGEVISKEEEIETLKKAESHSQRIASIIRTFKNFSRKGSEDPLECLPLYGILTDVEDLCAERAKSASVELRGFKVDESIQVCCRASEIVQVLVNLVGNAMDAIEETKQAGWVRASIESDPKQAVLMIRIEDSGPGVPAEIEKKIMEAFFTTKPKGKGTGLGLSISAKIARDHGGSLSLNREVSASCFELKLRTGEPPSQS